MNIFQVVFIGRPQGAQGRFDRRVALVVAESIRKDHIIRALNSRFEVNSISLREDVTQGSGLVVELPENLDTIWMRT